MYYLGSVSVKSAVQFNLVLRYHDTTRDCLSVSLGCQAVHAFTFQPMHWPLTVKMENILRLSFQYLTAPSIAMTTRISCLYGVHVHLTARWQAPSVLVLEQENDLLFFTVSTWACGITGTNSPVLSLSKNSIVIALLLLQRHCSVLLPDTGCEWYFEFHGTGVNEYWFS